MIAPLLVNPSSSENMQASRSLWIWVWFFFFSFFFFNTQGSHGDGLLIWNDAHVNKWLFRQTIAPIQWWYEYEFSRDINNKKNNNKHLHCRKCSVYYKTRLCCSLRTVKVLSHHQPQWRYEKKVRPCSACLSWILHSMHENNYDIRGW